MKVDKIIAGMMECISPVCLLAVIIPGFCLLDPQRSDAQLLPMYLAGWVLIFCSMFSRVVARRASSFALWLAVCAGALALTCLMGHVLAGAWLTGTYANVFMTGLVSESLWLSTVSARIRMVEKRRQRAARENDITWNEQRVTLEKPGLYGIAVATALYVVALWNHCPVMCNTALALGVGYALMLLFYRNVSVTESFLRDTKDLENVPGNKMRLLRRSRLLVLLAIVAAAALPALLTMGGRAYRDLRFLKFETVLDSEKLYFPGYTVPIEEALPDWVSEPHPAEQTPALFRQMEKVLPWIAAIGILALALRLISAYVQSFKGIPEENGDVAVSLAEDVAVQLRPERRRVTGRPVSERERVRRDYRRTIRRYRKRGWAPQPGETPRQIEDGTDIPEGFDVRALHEAYEKARYGS